MKTKLALTDEIEELDYYSNVRCQQKSKLDSAMALSQPVGTYKLGRNGRISEKCQPLRRKI